MPAKSEATGRHLRLPPTLPPRGLSRTEAAAYVGISATKFDQLVLDGRMPRAKRIDGRNVWDLRALDRAFDQLPEDGAPASDNPWD